MDKYFFKIIIPNYNCVEYIEKCIKSVEDQTFKDYIILVIDDLSTDGSLDKVKDLCKQYNNIIVIEPGKKLWNGGTRNVGIHYNINSEYTIFIDNDDWLNDNKCLETIHDIIEKNNRPDCVSLSYNCLVGDCLSYQPMIRNTQKELVDSLYVACWTKCIKSDLVVDFPENTLMEDVVQHIKQCDVLKTIVSCEKPIIVWNRNNINSCSRIENQNMNNGKWKSSMYRYAADLMDMICDSECCVNHRNWRLSVVLNNIAEGKYIQ